MQNSTILNNVSPTDLKQLMESILDSKLTPILNKLSGNTDGHELLTRNQVCELLDIDLSTLHHWRKKGKITAQGIGSRVYFKRSDVEAALTTIIE
jgi:excisionase family DNA binding protein